ncbi:MAG: hypothetical protein NT069_18710, partial [Planctomycetota bacterium]|nr:hypothetical protein [Planctomycetota bacterium]
MNEILALSVKIGVEQNRSGSQSDWSPIVGGNVGRIHTSQLFRERHELRQFARETPVPLRGR